MGVDFYLPAGDDVDAFLAHCLQDWLVGDEDALDEALGYFCLQVLRPVADEEEAALDDVQSVLVQQGCIGIYCTLSELVVQFHQDPVLFLRLYLLKFALIVKEVFFGEVFEVLIDPVVLAHLAQCGYILLKLLLFLADGGEGVANLIDQI